MSASADANRPGGDARVTILRDRRNPDFPTELQEVYESDLVGGRLWAGVEFDVKPNSRISPATKQVQLRVKEEKDKELGTDQHPDTENHVDPTLPLSPTGGNDYKWQKRLNSAGEWQDTSEAFTTPNLSQSDTVNYRVLWPWNTSKPIQLDTKLWDHNGAHTVALVSATAGQKQVRFEAADDPADSILVKEFYTRKVPVQNLVITGVSTSNGTSDYFKFNPTAEESSDLLNPTVNFTIKDEGDFVGHAYRWRVRVRSTDIEEQATSVVYEGIALNTGAVVVPVNQARLAADSPSTMIKDWGTYNFNVSVHEYASEAEAQNSLNQDVRNGRLDTITLRSANLNIPYTMPSPNQSLKGHKAAMKYNPDDSSEIRLSYLLGDISRIANPTNQAKELKIELIPPTLGNPILTETSWPRFLNAPVLDRLLKRFESEELEPDSPYITVISAVDDHASEYRDHKPASMLAKNGRVFSQSSRYDLHVWYDGQPGQAVSVVGRQRSAMQGYISGIYNDITTNFVDDTGRYSILQPGTDPYSDGVQVYWHQGPTAGPSHSYSTAGGVSAQVLSSAQMVGQPAYTHIILSEQPIPKVGSSTRIGADGTTYPYPGTFRYGGLNRPVLCAIFIGSVTTGAQPAELTPAQKRYRLYRAPILGSSSLQYYSNTVLHELTHAALGDTFDRINHCVGAVPTCIEIGTSTSWFNSDMSGLNFVRAVDDRGIPYEAFSAYDRREEIIAILDNQKHGHR